VVVFFFFFQAEDGIRDFHVTGVQTCALPIFDRHPRLAVVLAHGGGSLPFIAARMGHAYEVRRECREAIAERPSSYLRRLYFDTRSEERRVGEEVRYRWWRVSYK